MSAAERAGKASNAEQVNAVNGASKRANGRASAPVLQSGFLVDLAHSARASKYESMSESVRVSDSKR